MLQGFSLEVDLWDFRDPFFKLHLFLPLPPLLDICIGSWMLRDWLADCIFSSVAYFASSRSQSFGLLCLLLALLLSCLLLALLFCPLLALLFSVLFIIFFFSTLSAALRAHRRFDVLLAVLVSVLLLYLLSTTGSSAVVQSPSLTSCSLAVAPSLFLSHHWLLGCGSVSDPLQRHFVAGYIFLDASPAPPTPLLGIAPVVIVGSR